jgi:DNA-binding MarR family transcriptional regulator
MTTNRMDSHQWDSSLDPEVVPLFLALQWAQSRSLAALKEPLVKHGVSMAEFDVLATLRNAPAPHEMTPKELQDEVVITSGGLTKVMFQLESRDLVQRLQRELDLRIKPVRLTAKGKTVIEKSMAEMVATTGSWIRESLDAGQIKQLTALLGKISN